MTLLRQTEANFQGEIILTVILRLKSYPQEQPTLSVKGGAANPYLGHLLFEIKVFGTVCEVTLL